MVFGTKRRKGRLATAPTLKRSSRQPETVHATVEPKEEEDGVKVALSSSNIPLMSQSVRSTPTMVPDEDGVELSIITSEQPAETQEAVSKWEERALTEMGSSSKASNVKGIERILEGRSPKPTDQRVDLASAETRDSAAPINEKRDLSSVKISPLNTQPKRGFFRNSSLRKSTTPSSRRKTSSLSSRNGPGLPAKALKMVKPETVQRAEKQVATPKEQKPQDSLSPRHSKPLPTPSSGTKSASAGQTLSMAQGKESLINNGDESTGIKIVVFDSEIKTKRRVRVTLLDTNKTLNLQGEKIEQFLSVILREALKMNQNIHIENGNIDDALSAYSPIPMTKAVSFVRKIGPNKDAPSRPQMQKFTATTEIQKEEPPPSDTYIKRVCSVATEDDSASVRVSHDTTIAMKESPPSSKPSKPGDEELSQSPISVKSPLPNADNDTETKQFDKSCPRNRSSNGSHHSNIDAVGPDHGDLANSSNRVTTVYNSPHDSQKSPGDDLSASQGRASTTKQAKRSETHVDCTEEGLKVTSEFSLQATGGLEHREKTGDRFDREKTNIERADIERTLASLGTIDNSTVTAIQTGMLLARQLGLLQEADGQKTAEAILKLAKQMAGNGGLEVVETDTLQNIPRQQCTEAYPVKEDVTVETHQPDSVGANVNTPKKISLRDEELHASEDRISLSTKNTCVQARTGIVPVVETVLSTCSEERLRDTRPPAVEQNASIAREHFDPRGAVVLPSKKSLDVKRIRNSFLRRLPFGRKKNTELRVLPMEHAKKVVEAAVEKAVKTALVDDVSLDEDDSELFSRSSDESSRFSGDSNAFSSSFFGSEDASLEDDLYSSSHAPDDSTLGTVYSLDEMISWAQSRAESPQEDIILTYAEGSNNAATLAILSEAKDGEIEIVDEMSIGSEEQESINSVPTFASKSVMSEENGFNHFEEQTTPLMEAFVFYIENTLDTMNKVKKTKKSTKSRTKGKVDENLSYVSEGLLHSFVNFMGKEEKKGDGKTSNGGGGRGLASTEEPIQEIMSKSSEESDDWGDVLQSAPSDDMMRSAFGIITSTLSEEFSEFNPTEASRKKKRR